jgi:hypothetical protein
LTIVNALGGFLRARREQVSPKDVPRVGDLSLTSNKLLTSGTPGLMVVVYHAVPGSPDAAKLNALLS